LFHDCGYAFEKLTEGFRAFSDRVLSTDLEPHFHWERALLSSGSISPWIESITKYFAICKKFFPDLNRVGALRTSIFRILIQLAALKFDHGVISAIILLQNHKQAGAYPKIDNIDDIMNIASLGMALHNDPVYRLVSEKTNKGICLRINPIPFLLAYCDTAQEWGRLKYTSDEKTKASPYLDSIILPQPGDVKRFEIKLFFPAGAKGIRPDTPGDSRDPCSENVDVFYPRGLFVRRSLQYKEWC
jgi:hypothetical protein